MDSISKLIYVDRLKKDILALHDCYNGFSDTYDKACIIGVIDEQPTIESKKGKWTRPFPTRPKTYERFCSECKGKAWYCGTGDYNFCPNCGADMREGEQE